MTRDEARSAQQLLTRRGLLSLGALTGAGLLSGCAAGAGGSGTGGAPAGTDFTPSLDPVSGVEQPHLTIGFVPITCASPLINAQALNVFEHYGITVTLRRFTGWAELWIAFVAGELDATQMLAPMPLAIHHGFADGQRDIRLPYVTNTNGNGITVAAGLHGRVEGPEDFAGLRLGLPFQYSVHNLLARDYLASGGLDPDQDVDLRIMRPADMVSALTVGDIDAFCLPDQFNQRAVATEAGFIHRLTKDLWEGHPCCSFAVADDFAQANPRTYTALLRAVGDAARWTDDPAHREVSAETMAGPGYLNLDPAVLGAVLTGQFPDGTGRTRDVPDRIGFQPYPHQTYGLWLITQMQRWGLAPQEAFSTAAEYSAAVSSVFDAGAVSEVLGELGMDTTERTHETILGERFDPADPAGWTQRQAER